MICTTCGYISEICQLSICPKCGGIMIEIDHGIPTTEEKKANDEETELK
ncbi:MAG: hypothetical protein M0P07_04755 [Candidatus Methanomethylophilaceae archaeon]|nr:hypothetical protein [Candidatus Methanomethylophilaceae archaeon]MDY0246350.1 hypothetical protein [Methanosarcina mazei]